MRPSKLLAGLAAAATLAVLGVIALSAGGPERATGAGARPNIVMIMTDDQALSSVRYMPTVRRSLARRGTTFRNSFASYPLCCPSRATFLTGQYAHNHRVLSNTGPRGGYKALDHSRTLPVWLQRSGYFTAHVGKYLNEYGQPRPRVVPPGWSRWFGSVDPSTYQMFGYTINSNGNLIRYGNGASHYQTDVYARTAEEIIRRRVPEPAPFFLNLAFLAPHEERDPPAGPNPRPAPRHAGRAASVRLPRPRSFNEGRISDKPSFVRNRSRLSGRILTRTSNRYRDRVRALIAVDEAVGRVLNALRDTGELNNTVVIFTSDNGYFHGEYRFSRGKYLPYDPASRVPLIIRGPGVRGNRKVSSQVSNVDLAPTIADFANATPDRRFDGLSLTRLLARRRGADRRFGKRSLLFEAGDGGAFSRARNAEPEQAPDYGAVRTKRYLYIRNRTGSQELYDLRRDRSLLANVHGQRRYRRAERTLARRLRGLRRCKGTRCSPR